MVTRGKQSNVLHLRVSDALLDDIKAIALTQRRSYSFIARDLMEDGLKARKLPPKTTIGTLLKSVGAV